MKIKVCCATDENYVEMTSVMLVSLLANSREDVSEIHVFCYRVSRRGMDVLKGVAPDLVTIHDHRRVPPEIVPVPISVRPSASMWMRIMAPDVISANDEHLLYLDCDVIVDRRLDALANLDMQGHVIGAVEDYAKPKHGGWNARLGVPEATPYFNSGVLVIDHRRYRDEGWSAKVIGVARAIPERLMHVDQDALNVVCGGAFRALPYGYNAHASSAKTKHGDGAELFAGAHIIHYVGKRKPTDVDCRHAAKDVYLRYRAMTVWRDTPLRPAWRREVFNHLRQGLGAVRRWWSGTRLGRRFPAAP